MQMLKRLKCLGAQLLCLQKALQEVKKDGVLRSRLPILALSTLIQMAFRRHMLSYDVTRATAELLYVTCVRGRFPKM